MSFLGWAFCVGPRVCLLFFPSVFVCLEWEDGGFDRAFWLGWHPGHFSITSIGSSFWGRPCWSLARHSWLGDGSLSTSVLVGGSAPTKVVSLLWSYWMDNWSCLLPAGGYSGVVVLGFFVHVAACSCCWVLLGGRLKFGCVCHGSGLFRLSPTNSSVRVCWEGYLLFKKIRFFSVYLGNYSSRVSSLILMMDVLQTRLWKGSRSPSVSMLTVARSPTNAQRW